MRQFNVIFRCKNFRQERKAEVCLLMAWTVWTAPFTPTGQLGNVARCLWPTAFHNAPPPWKQQCWTYLDPRFLAYICRWNISAYFWPLHIPPWPWQGNTFSYSLSSGLFHNGREFLPDLALSLEGVTKCKSNCESNSVLSSPAASVYVTRLKGHSHAILVNFKNQKYVLTSMNAHK